MLLVVKFIFWIVCHKLPLPENQFHDFRFVGLFPQNLEGDSISREVPFDNIFEGQAIAEGLAVGFGDNIPGFESCLFGRRS